MAFRAFNFTRSYATMKYHPATVRIALVGECVDPQVVQSLS